MRHALLTHASSRRALPLVRLLALAATVTAAATTTACHPTAQTSPSPTRTGQTAAAPIAPPGTAGPAETTETPIALDERSRATEATGAPMRRDTPAVESTAPIAKNGAPPPTAASPASRPRGEGAGMLDGLAKGEAFGAFGPSGGGGLGASTHGALDRARAAAPSAMAGGYRDADMAMAQAGPIKAGEWDDNANYREFQRWLATESALDFHRVDVRARRFLVVRDVDGKAVPRCPVTVSAGQTRLATLTTTASGRAIFFPFAEGLGAQSGARADADLVATATCAGTSASAHFSIRDDGDGIVDLHLATPRVLPARKTVDVAFILDTTGSMAEEIAAIKSTIDKVARTLDTEQTSVRIGMVEYKDRGDPFVTRVYPMSTDLDAFSRAIAGIQASGGGDLPESMNEGLHVGLTQLDWNDPSVVKLAFLIADAPPHLDYPQDFDYAADMRRAAHDGIEVFTVAASGMDDLGQVVFRQIAQYTGGTNMFVARGGAGPQSTGGGDPKSSCGGRQTQFQSGNLDALITSKIRQELHALDRDPARIAGLRTDENAKPCDQRVVYAVD